LPGVEFLILVNGNGSTTRAKTLKWSMSTSNSSRKWVKQGHEINGPGGWGGAGPRNQVV